MFRNINLLRSLALASIVAVLPFQQVFANDAKKSEQAAKRPGFHTEIVDGRLWVFREGSDELKTFKADGEPAKSITRVGAGPNGLTVRAVDAETLDAYLALR